MLSGVGLSPQDFCQAQLRQVQQRELVLAVTVG
jgi:hypothetical protein